MSVAVPFPSVQPPGYSWLADEPDFDPAVHLQLEPPADVALLTGFGYDAESIAPTATDVAVSAPFRVLSDEGAAVLLDTCRRLRVFAKRAGNRIEHTVRGGCYRSRFLRDLCIDPDVTATMSAI